MSEKPDRKLLATGIVGTAIAALCWFAPVLGVLLGAMGLLWAPTAATEQPAGWMI